MQLYWKLWFSLFTVGVVSLELHVVGELSETEWVSLRNPGKG